MPLYSVSFCTSNNGSRNEVVHVGMELTNVEQQLPYRTFCNAEKKEDIRTNYRVSTWICKAMKKGILAVLLAGKLASLH